MLNDIDLSRITLQARVDLAEVPPRWWDGNLGRVLLKRQAGDTVVFRKPSGEIELTVVDVRWS